MVFKNRRPVKALNKNQARLMKRAAEERQANSAGNLAERYPSVKQLDIQMEFVSREGDILGSSRRTIQPHQLINFMADCPGRCGNGRMDMGGVITQMITNRQASRDTKGLCREILLAGSTDTCNCELTAKITIQYEPLAEPQ